MRISILVNEVQGGWEPTDTRLGGTEESVVYWATEIKKRGHEVLVFRNGRDEENAHSHDGVPYIHRDAFFFDDGNPDVFINIKSHDFKGGDRFMAGQLMPRRPVIYFTNETDASQYNLSSYDAIVWPSQWAADHIPVNNQNVYVVPHGYDSSKTYPDKKISKQCFYASSPDRGLSTLLAAWPRVKDRHPDATLLVTYGGEGPELPGVKYTGNITEDEMNEIYRTSDIWCHPCNGGELFCITGVKAQAAGCVPVVIDKMALKETVKHGFFCGRSENYANLLCHVLDNPDIVLEARGFLADEHYADWGESTDRLLEVINKIV